MNEMVYIQAVNKFHNHFKKCEVKTCCVKYNGDTYRRVKVKCNCTSEAWIVVINSNQLKLDSGVFNTHYDEMEYDENSHCLKISSEHEGTLFITPSKK